MHEKIALAAFDCIDVTWTYKYHFTDHLQMYADSHWEWTCTCKCKGLDAALQ